MDFDLSEEQNILQATARNFMEKECPIQIVRELEADEKGYSPELWRKMAGLGWLGINIPEEYGGSGGNFFDIVLLAEEMGRALFPGPFMPTVVLAGPIILKSGSDEQKKKYLPEITRGQTIITLAVTESDGRLDPAGIGVTAVRSGDNFIIEGTKNFVPYAPVADSILCVTRTENNVENNGGITLFLVDSRATGVKIEPLATITGEKLSKVTFNGVVVSKEDMVGELGHGWSAVEEAVSEAAVAEGAYMAGSARWVLDTAVDYAKEREQFGVPIGSFQAIQHKCADMLMDVDGAVFIVYFAAWAITVNEPEKNFAASEAKAWVSDMAPRVASEGIQVMGGIGITLEHDMQLYYRRVKASETAYGDSHYHREKLARMLKL
ncbi:MAG: acyl-CoA/acyl-ACP dehydrogenase [Deltaproteobacteria bacterium]|nr:acyl-CoA/acyl-ACP dehydrogenase [Deltaproteobacteria bacterium]